MTFFDLFYCHYHSQRSLSKNPMDLAAVKAEYADAIFVIQVCAFLYNNHVYVYPTVM